MGQTKIIKLLILLALVGCTERTKDGRFVANLDKASMKNIDLNEYCQKIEIISLNDADTLSPESRFSVFDKGFIIQKDSTCLVYFDKTGHFQQ